MEPNESWHASGVTRRIWGSIMGPVQQEALVSFKYLQSFLSHPSSPSSLGIPGALIV